MLRIELNEEDAALLTLTLGFATGAALQGGNRPLAASILKLTNTILKDRPGYTPYEVPEEWLRAVRPD